MIALYKSSGISCTTPAESFVFIFIVYQMYPGRSVGAPIDSS
jgi:hypothetical protein